MPELEKIVLDGTEYEINSQVDSALSDTSTNPVQNKVVKAAIDALAPKKEILVREISGENYGKYGGTFSHAIDGDLFNKCFVYACRAFSVDLKANKKYLLAYLTSSSTSKRTTTLKPNRFDTEKVGAVELDENGNLGDVVTTFEPTYDIWHFNPNNTSSGIWDTETYDQYNIRVYNTFPEVVDSATYYWKGIVFTSNIDFHGVIALNNDSMLLNDDYFLLFEINDDEWNPYVDGGMEKGYELEKPSEVSQEEREEIAQIAVQSYAEKYNCLYGKKWACCGDSLTQYSGGQGHVDNESDTGFVTQIMRRTGVIGTPLGTAGEKWSSGTDGTFEAGSAVERVNTIVNGTEDYDIITFAYGTNTDVDGEGTVNDEPAYNGTMCAAIKWCIEQLVAWKPTISIGIILPPKRADMGASGNTLMQTRGALIKEVASMYGVPCCDMWSESGINLMHYTNPSTGNEKYYYLSDMLHLSDNGKIQYGKRLKAFLEEITPIY